MSEEPQQQPHEMTCKERGQASRSGNNAASVIRGDPIPESEKPPRQTVRHPQTESHYSSPAEFLAGPSKPGKVNKGLRRNENAHRDSVGYMLTDEYLMSGGANGGANGGAGGRSGNRKPAVPRAKKTALGRGLQVTEEEPKFRTGCKITHPMEPMDAPYFEDNDPKPPRDAPVVHGKRHVKPRRNRDDQVFLEPGSPSPTAAGGKQPETKPSRTNKSNQSRNVINLSQYTAEELNEPPVQEKVLGPRKFEAPDMPPAKPPAIKPINGPAKQEHDVLGAGRFGKPEEPKPAGKAQGSCRPPKDSANLFGGAARRPVKKNTNKAPPPPPPKNNILKYYDPECDNPADFAPPPTRVKVNQTNKETKPEPEKPPRKSASKSNISSIKLE